MMRPMAKTASAAAAAVFSPKKEKAADYPKKELEVRPGGMLVQVRKLDSDDNSICVPTIRVKAKYAGVYHEIYISSQATFGELKKMVSARAGLHPEDLKIMFKDKERDPKAFLDTAGMKDRSKVVVLDDPTAHAKRLIKERHDEKMEKAAKSISRISHDVDKLASKVTMLETIVNKGGKVVENDVIRLTELLMNELLKLDAIVAADGDVKEKRRMQVKRVQKYVEALDAINLKNAKPKTNGQINHQKPPLPPPPTQAKMPQPPPQPQQQRRQFQQPSPMTGTTKNWDMVDLLSALPSTSAAATSTTTMAASTSLSPTTRFDWELF